MKRVGIYYICTGQYSQFWKGFFESAEQYFLKGFDYEIHYFVFSDDDKLPYLNHERVHYHFQEKQNWPWPTLLRFRTFYSIKSEVEGLDYLFFVNSNIEFVAQVTDEIIPREPEKLSLTHHFGYYLKPEITHTYDRNKQCAAYIAYGTGEQYVSGGFMGGESHAFLEMSAILDRRINADLKNNRIALWHDESQLNKYALGRKDLNFLHPGYFYPEIFTLNYPMITKVLEKYKYFPVANFKAKPAEERKKEWYQKHLVDRFLKPRKGSVVYLETIELPESRLSVYALAISLKSKGYRVKLISFTNIQTECRLFGLQQERSTPWKLKWARKNAMKYQFLHYFEKTLAFHKEFFEEPSVINQGLWLSNEYFQGQEEQLKKAFSGVFLNLNATVKSMCADWKDAQTVVILDPESSTGHPDINRTLDLKYLQESLNFFRSKSPEFQSVWLGTNIDTWKHSGLKGKFVDVSGLGMFELIYLISQATHTIVSPDLRSWWGGWLLKQTNPDAIVIGPEPWFTDFREDSSTALPADWQRFKHDYSSCF
jgi:hypothetical protein